MQLKAVKRKEQFEKIIKEGKKVMNSHFVIYYLPSLFFEDEETKIGISVGKKQGNACTRNFYKRRIRHILREIDVDIKQKYAIIIMRPACLNKDYQEMKQKLTKVLKGIK